MAGKSNISTLISLRIPIDLLEAIDSRVNRQKCLPENRNQYIIRVLRNEVTRSHHKKRGSNV